MNESLKEFLNPKAALTIGGSAAMVIAFTTTLCGAFQLPAATVALMLSGVFAAVQLVYAKEKLIAKILYWAICTLIIFHTARGGNSTLGDATASPSVTPSVLEMVVPSVSLSFDLATTAYAADTNQTDKYYLAYTNGEGSLVYTNVNGVEYTNTIRKLFQQWRWK
jgi:hypothetical protein